jgi:uncharacterized membrane protein YfhO
MKLNIKKQQNPFLGYSILFIIIAVFLVGYLGHQGLTMIWDLDGWHQHYPILVHFRAQVLSWLQQPGQLLSQWNWHVGLGADNIQTFSYYIYGDIFSYFAIFVPVKFLTWFFSGMVIIRLYFVGLSFIFLAKKLMHQTKAIAVGALCYVFTGYAITASFNHPFFLTPLIILPLLVLGCLNLLDGKSGRLFLISLIWTLISNFYFAYMLLLGMGIFLLIMWSVNRKQFTKQVLKRMLLNTIVAFGLSAWLFVPSAAAVFTSARSVNQFANGFILYPLNYYISFLFNLIANFKSPFWLNLGFVAPAIFACFFVSHHAHESKQYLVLKRIFIVSLLMMLLPWVAAVMNGFSAPSNRWTFLLGLPVSLALTSFLAHLKQIDVFDRRLFLGFTICVSLIYGFENYFGTSKATLGFIALLWLSLISCYLAVKHRQLMIRLLYTLPVLAVAFMLLFNLSVKGNGTEKQLVSHSQASWLQQNNQQLPKLKNQRIATQQTTSTIRSMTNTGLMVSDFNNIDTYFSLQNKDLAQVMQDVGNNQMNANQLVQQLDSRSQLLKFFGVKRIYTKQSILGYQAQKTKGATYQTATVFPLAFEARRTLSLTQYRKLDATDREAALQTVAVVQKGQQKAFANSKKITATIAGQSTQKTITLTVKNPKAGQVIQLQQLSGLPKQELQADFTNLQFKPMTNQQQASGTLGRIKQLRTQLMTLGNDNNGYRLTLGTHQQPTLNAIQQEKRDNLSFYQPVTSRVLNLGYFKALPDKLVLHVSKPGTYRFKLKVKAVKDNPSAVQYAQRHALQHMKQGQNSLSGRITAKASHVLVTTIPYSSGWQDSQHQVIKVDNGLLGVKLHAGKNQIQLRYHTPFLRTGIVISLLTLIGVLGRTFYVSRRPIAVQKQSAKTK